MMMCRRYTTTTMNKKSKITEGILFCLVVLLCAGIRGFFLAGGQIPVRDDASLYEASMIREERNEPVMTSGAVFAYTEILEDVLRFTGNKLEAVAGLQLLLQCATVVLLYLGCRLLSGSVAAFLEALFFSVFPFFLKLVFQAAPENTYLIGFAFLLLLVGLCGSVMKKDGFYRRSRDEFLILLTGFVSGALLIWHLMTLVLIILFLLMVTGNAGKIQERRRGFRNRKNMEELLRGAKEEEADRKDRKQKGELQPMSLPAHILILLCGILIGIFVTLMKYTGVTGNTFTEQFAWWIHSFTGSGFQGLTPAFVFLLPGSVLASGMVQLLINKIVGKKENVLSSGSEVAAMAEEVKRAELPADERMRTKTEDAEPAAGKGKSAAEGTEPVVTEKPADEGEKKDVEEKKGKKKINYIENPLPGPKKHVKRNFDFKIGKRKDDFDIDIEEGDDFDI